MTKKEKTEEKKFAKEILVCRRLIGGRTREAIATAELRKRGLDAEEIACAVEIEELQDTMRRASRDFESRHQRR